jgi:ABC-type transport system substrate-binding protein
MVKWDFEERILQEDKGVAMYGQVNQYIDDIEIVDDLTLQFTFQQPAPHWQDIMALTIIADPDMFITDEGEVALGNEEDKQIGSGAFENVEYVPGSHLYLEAHDGYWEEGVPRLDRIEIRFFGDAASMVAALEAGEIDYAFNPPFDAAQRFMDNDDYKVWVPKTNGVASILMVNPESEELRDPLVRQAINYAIDRNAINEVAYAGMGNPSSVFTLPDTLGYTEELEVPLDGDPERARELLEQAGSPDVSVDLTYGSNNDLYRLILEVIQQNLQDVGIEASLDPVDRNVYIQKRTSQDFDILPSLIAGVNKHPAGLQDSFVFEVREDGLNDFFDDIEAQEPFLQYRDAFARGLSATSQEEADEAFDEALLAAKRGAWVLMLVGQPFNLAVSPSNLKGVTWTEADKPVFKYTFWE